MPTPYTGCCGCGAIRYRVTAEPLISYLCHCTECQRRTSSAFGLNMNPGREPSHRTGRTDLAHPDRRQRKRSGTQFLRRLRHATVLGAVGSAERPGYLLRHTR